VCAHATVLWGVHMTRPDQSNIRNEILSALPAEDFALLRPYLQSIDLALKKTLIVPDEPIRHVYFPDQGVASMLALLEGGGSVEVGITSCSASIP
jgi:CRP-like cAMP-binding protein